MDGHKTATRDTKRIVVCGTGFKVAEKAVVQAQCIQLGCKYHPDLVAGFTTHLLCRSLLGAVNTIKYTKALEWGVQVVSYDWLADSLAAGAPLPAADYKTDRPRSQGILTAAQLNTKAPAAPPSLFTQHTDAPITVSQPQHAVAMHLPITQQIDGQRHCSENISPGTQEPQAAPPVQHQGNGWSQLMSSFATCQQAPHFSTTPVHGRAAAGSMPDVSPVPTALRQRYYQQQLLLYQQHQQPEDPKQQHQQHQQATPAHHAVAAPSPQSEFSFGMRPAAQRPTHAQPSVQPTPTTAVPQLKPAVRGGRPSEPDTPRLLFGADAAADACAAAVVMPAAGAVIVGTHASELPQHGGDGIIVSGTPAADVNEADDDEDDLVTQPSLAVYLRRKARTSAATFNGPIAAGHNLGPAPVTGPAASAVAVPAVPMAGFLSEAADAPVAPTTGAAGVGCVMDEDQGAHVGHAGAMHPPHDGPSSPTPTKANMSLLPSVAGCTPVHAKGAAGTVPDCSPVPTVMRQMYYQQQLMLFQQQHRYPQEQQLDHSQQELLHQQVAAPQRARGLAVRLCLDSLLEEEAEHSEVDAGAAAALDAPPLAGNTGAAALQAGGMAQSALEANLSGPDASHTRGQTHRSDPSTTAPKAPPATVQHSSAMGLTQPPHSGHQTTHNHTASPPGSMNIAAAPAAQPAAAGLDPRTTRRRARALGDGDQAHGRGHGAGRSQAALLQPGPYIRRKQGGGPAGRSQSTAAGVAGGQMVGQL